MLFGVPKNNIRRQFFSRKLRALALFPFVLPLFFSAHLFADTVRLVSGRVLEGKIVNQNRRFIMLKSGSRVLRISKKDIDTIRYDRSREKKRKAAARPVRQPPVPRVEPVAKQPAPTRAAPVNSTSGALWPGALLPGWTRYSRGDTLRGGILAGAHLALGMFALSTAGARSAAETRLQSLENTALASLSIPSGAVAVNIFARVQADEQRAAFRARTRHFNVTALVLAALYAYNIWDAVHLPAGFVARPPMKNSYGTMAVPPRAPGLHFAFRITI